MLEDKISARASRLELEPTVRISGTSPAKWGLKTGPLPNPIVGNEYIAILHDSRTRSKREHGVSGMLHQDPTRNTNSERRLI